MLLALACRLAVAQQASPQDTPGQDAAIPPGQQPGVETDLGGTKPVLRNSVLSPFATVAAGYSTNLDHATTNGLSGAAVDGEVGLHVRRTGNLTVNADLAGLYQEYVGGVNLPGQFLPSANANASYMAIPEILYFTAQDTLGQITTQSLDALADATRQNSNYFTAGPELMIPFDARDMLVTQATYGRSSFSHSDISSNRYIGDASLGRQIGARTNLSANYHYQQIRYDHSEIYPTARSSSAFLRLNAQGSRTFLALEAGWEQVKVGAQTVVLLAAPGSLLPPVSAYVPAENRQTPHIGLAAERKLTPLMALTAEYHHGVSDASESLRTSAQNGFNSANSLDVQAFAQPFTADNAYVMLTRTTPLGNIAVQVTEDRETYQQAPVLNRKAYGADAFINHQLSPLWTVNTTLRWQHGSFVNTDVPDNRLLVSLGLSRMISRSLTAGLLYQRNSGTGQQSVLGTTLAASTGSFTENRVLVSLSYSPQAVTSQVFDPVSRFRYFQGPQTLQPPAPGGVSPFIEPGTQP
jgi:hypothetical protein